MLLLGWYFFGQPTFNLKENLIEAAIKELRTLFESPIQVIFNLDIGFFLISSTVNTSDKICVGWEDGLNPLIIGIQLYKDQSNFIKKLMDNKLLTIRAADQVVRILPPLNVKKSELDLSLKIINKVCKELN